LPDELTTICLPTLAFVATESVGAAAAEVALGAVVTDELAVLVAGVELELVDAFDVEDEPPHPAMTRTALTTTVDTRFEGFTFTLTDVGAVEIAKNANYPGHRPSTDTRPARRPCSMLRVARTEPMAPG
jgi:hypothetical protein